MCDVKVWYVESKWKSYDMKPWGANKEGKYWKGSLKFRARSRIVSLLNARCRCSQVCRDCDKATNPYESALQFSPNFGTGFILGVNLVWIPSENSLNVWGLYCFGLWNPQIQDVLPGSQRCAIMIWTYLNILSVSCGGAFAGKCLAAEAGILAFWWNGMICWKSKHVSTLPFCCKQPRRTNMITAIFVLDFCFVFGSVWEILKMWQNSRMAWDWKANSNGFYTAWYHYNTMRIPY